MKPVQVENQVLDFSFKSNKKDKVSHLIGGFLLHLK